MKRLNYNEIKIGDLLKVRLYEDGLTDAFIEGRVTNKYGQNVMLHAYCYISPKHPEGIISFDYEVFNPKYAKAYRIEENTRI